MTGRLGKMGSAFTQLLFCQVHVETYTRKERRSKTKENKGQKERKAERKKEGK